MSLPAAAFVGPAHSPALDRALTTLAAGLTPPPRSATRPSLGGAPLPLDTTLTAFGDHILVRLRPADAGRELSLGAKLAADGLALDVPEGAAPDAVREVMPYQVALRDRSVLARLLLGSAVAALARSHREPPALSLDADATPPANAERTALGLPKEGYGLPWRLMTWKPPAAIQPGPGGLGRFTLSWPQSTFPGAFQSSGPAAAEEALLLGLYEAVFRADLTELARAVALGAIRSGFRGHPTALLTAAVAAAEDATPVCRSAGP